MEVEKILARPAALAEVRARRLLIIISEGVGGSSGLVALSPPIVYASACISRHHRGKLADKLRRQRQHEKCLEALRLQYGFSVLLDIMHKPFRTTHKLETVIKVYQPHCAFQP